MLVFEDFRCRNRRPTKQNLNKINLVVYIKKQKQARDPSGVEEQGMALKVRRILHKSSCQRHNYMKTLY